MTFRQTALMSLLALCLSSCDTPTEPTPITTIVVSAPSETMASGATLQLTATAQGRRGQPLDGRTITWTSSRTEVATVSVGGLVTAGAVLGAVAESVTITASAEGVSGSVTLSVAPAAAATVTVTPTTTTIGVGSTQALSALVKDAAGATLEGRTVTWLSSDPLIATVSSSGLVTAQAYAGAATRSVTITATSESRSGTATVLVTPSPVATVTVDPATLTLGVGGERELTAIPKDAAGHELDGRTITWATSDAAVATVSSMGLVSAVSVGSVTITATSETKTGTATVTIVAPVHLGSVVAGGNSSMMLRADGFLYAAGKNDLGQLGDGTTNDLLSPVMVRSGVSRTALQNSSALNSLFLTTDGVLLGYGRDCAFGLLGLMWQPIGSDACPGGTQFRTTPVTLATGVTRAAITHDNLFFVKTDGTLWGLGVNVSGTFGTGDYTSAPEAIQIATGVQDVWAVEQATVYFLKTDGSLWGMGNGYAGELAVGLLDDDQTTPVLMMTGVASVAGGSEYVLIVRTDGTLWGAGANDRGQLGDGTLTSRPEPVAIMSGVAMAAAGTSGTSMILKEDGTLWATGNNLLGGFGNGSTTSSASPVQVMTGVAQVAVGNGHTIIIKVDGSFWASGLNNYGQLGTGDTADKTTFARMLPFWEP